MSVSFSYTQLKQSLEGGAAAFRSITRLQPAGGPSDKVFPPTYKDARYAIEKRVLPAQTQPVDCILLDSVQSQANRLEPTLLDLWEEGAISLPVIRLDFAEADLPRKLQLTSLEVPHRISDALLRDSLLKGQRFRDSEVGKVLDNSDLRNSTGLFQYCPSALLFGLWDSTGPRGGLGVKYQRLIVSEIIGVNFSAGVRTASRLDPTQVVLKAGPLYDDNQGSYTLDENKAKKDKGKPVLYKKTGRPSEANLGNVTPDISKPEVGGGVTFEYAQQTVVLSLPALRRLRFPLDGKTSTEVDSAARCVLAAMGLLAVTVSQERGYDLRSRCLLVPEEALSWEVVQAPGKEPTRFQWNSREAIDLYQEAVERATKLGLPWQKEPIELTPTPQLAALVKKSQEQLLGGLVQEEE